jgi:peptidoglycan/xylan/chitin deacetylase (PgdA/CDA1 family)
MDPISLAEETGTQQPSTARQGLELNLLDRLVAAACLVKKGGIIINYHTLTRAETESQVELLSGFFDLVDHAGLVSRLNSPGKRPYCLMTFDDGKCSNASVAGEELTRLGVPAVFFVVTQFLTLGTKPLWFDRAAALVRRLGTDASGVDIDSLKLLPEAMRDERLDRLCAHFGVDADMSDEHVRPMTWDQARRLNRQGHTIGSHTRWHCILPYESLEFAKEDVSESILAVSREIGEPCETFSFPNGNYTAELARHAMAHGVHSVMTTEPTWVSPRCPPWRLPRIQLHAGHHRSRHSGKIGAAAVGRFLKNPDGTGRAYVKVNRLDAIGPQVASPGSSQGP